MTTTTTNGYDVLTAFQTAPVAPPKRPRCRVKDDAFNWVLVGIAQRVTAHIEQGIDVDQLEQLAKVFGVLPSTLVPDGNNGLRTEVAASVTAAMVEHGQTPEQLAEVIGMSAPPLKSGDAPYATSTIWYE